MGRVSSTLGPRFGPSLVSPGCGQQLTIPGLNAKPAGWTVICGVVSTGLGVGAAAVAAVGCGRMAGAVCSSGWVWNSVWGCAGGRDWAGEEAWAGGAACTGAGRAVFRTAAATEQGRETEVLKRLATPGAAPILRDLAREGQGSGQRAWGQAAAIPWILEGLAHANIKNQTLTLLAVLLRRLVTGWILAWGQGAVSGSRRRKKGLLASTVSWPRVPRWCSSSVTGCLGHWIQTPGLSPRAGCGF